MLKKILLSIFVIAVLAGGLWYFFNIEKSNKNTSITSSESVCSRSFKPVMKSAPYYEGVLFDAHLHLPTQLRGVSDASAEFGLPTPMWNDELSPEYVKCLFDKEGTSGAFSFHLLTKFSTTAEVAIAKEMEHMYPGVFVHFLMPTMINETIDPSTEAIGKILEDNPGLFRGIGELKMFDGKSPDDPYILSILDLAKKHDLIVMMHPFGHHKSAVEKIVRLYPNVTFLIHGIVNDEGPAVVESNLSWVEKLIMNNSNVYYSIDADGLPIYGWLARHEGSIVPKQELLPYALSQFETGLNQNLQQYKQIIEAHPNRFLSGTDRWYRTHYDEEISALIEEHRRAFIGRLVPGVQERFAHTNAENLFKK
jgi:hypothetical protein